MIRYALVCDKDHRFESWFQSADAFDRLSGAGHLACTVCGSDQVRKSVMAPRIGKQVSVAPASRPAKLNAPENPEEQAIRALRKDVETNSEDVGQNFAREARKMHDGDAPKRSIYGEARPADAIALLKDGVPVMPLPFIPSRKTN